jgi:hypothetical protein
MEKMIGLACRCVIRVFQDTSFVRAGHKIFKKKIHRPGSLWGRRDRDAVLSSKLEEILSATESVAKFGEPPRSDDLKRGIEGLEGEFEANLVIAFRSRDSTLTTKS